jgi:hypothetical protein
VIAAQRELDLTPPSLPGTVWLAAGPPLLNAALFSWLRAHWKDLPSIYPPEASPVWHQGALHSVETSMISASLLGLWITAQGIAMWYGSPRSSAHRAFFHSAIATAWAHSLMFPAITLLFNLQLTWPWAALCGAIILGGLVLVAGFAHRIKKEYKEGELGYGCYFDRHDPVMFGPRGLNIGHPWQWALCAGALIPIFLVLFLP